MCRREHDIGELRGFAHEGFLHDVVLVERHTSKVGKCPVFPPCHAFRLPLLNFNGDSWDSFRPGGPQQPCLSNPLSPTLRLASARAAFRMSRRSRRASSFACFRSSAGILGTRISSGRSIKLARAGRMSRCVSRVHHRRAPVYHGWITLKSSARFLIRHHATRKPPQYQRCNAEGTSG